MTAWNKQLGECSCGRSLLLKGGILGIGIVAVLWTGWAQPHIRHHNRSPLPSVTHQSTAIQKSLHLSIHASHESSDSPSTLLEKKGPEESPQIVDATLLVDLNLSSRMELETLPGIGVKLADRIVSYRSSHGAFQKVDDLVKVSGIGGKRLRRLAPFVTIEKRKKIS
jgi:comEA protein